jgi:hypothetical protein
MKEKAGRRITGADKSTEPFLTSFMKLDSSGGRECDHT